VVCIIYSLKTAANVAKWGTYLTNLFENAIPYVGYALDSVPLATVATIASDIGGDLLRSRNQTASDVLAVVEAGAGTVYPLVRAWTNTQGFGGDIPLYLLAAFTAADIILGKIDSLKRGTREVIRRGRDVARRSRSRPQTSEVELPESPPSDPYQ